MALAELKSALPSYAKDIKLNLGRVLAADGMDGLSRDAVAGIALASAYATKHKDVITAITEEVDASSEIVDAAKAAATVMAMNNVYYRFVHLVSDGEYAKMPANLRMNVIGNPGIDKIDFELMSLAVSAINGCGMCMDAHVAEVIKGGVTRQGVQTAIRIGAVLSAAAQALEIEAAT
ncbi:alkyl hydroperoxide reductase AhpD [Algimonas ampicilliniresistens]|uniref:Alkyl hydroperoxide reductase AhpD n=1 Tax=Algimonas ampicilliniresistens TaxID=1298735 RepID=A0ABQ5VAP4_9PROT|nr:carboxymuconolactone decarboxylase family protein [Algimonas ampicilliniresistens]GLQ24054.1 alkyl hydroperoxide reductase AhpD [Algimonas ampicilliniresistens]